MTSYSARSARYSYAGTTWGAAAPTNAATWTHIPVLDAPLPKRDLQLDGSQESDSDGMASLDFATVRGGSMSFSTRCHTPPLVQTTTGDMYLDQVFNSYFGCGAQTGNDFAKTTTTTGGSGSTVVLTAHASDLAAGNAIQVSNDVRFITAISSDNVTLDSAPTSVAAGQDVYGGSSWAFVAAEIGYYNYINCELGCENVMLGPGSFTGLKITNVGGKDPLRLQVDFSSLSFSTGVTPLSLTYNDATYTGPILVGKGSTVAIDGTEITVADLSVDFGCKHEEIQAVSGEQGRAGFACTSCEPVVEFTEYWRSTDWTKYTGRDRVSLRLSVVGDTASAATRAATTWAVWLPAAQLTVEDTIVNGQRGQKIKAVGKRPTQAQKTAGLTSPVYFSCFGGTI